MQRYCFDRQIIRLLPLSRANTRRFYVLDPLSLILSATTLRALFPCHGSYPDAARIAGNFIADFGGVSPAQLCLTAHLGEGAASLLPISSPSFEAPETLSPSWLRV